MQGNLQLQQYNLLIQLLPLQSSVFVVLFSNAIWPRNKASPKGSFQNGIVPLLVIFHLSYSNYIVVVIKIKFFCSCRICIVRVALVPHSCRTRVVRVSLVLHLCCICATRVARVAVMLLVSGTRIVNQTRLKHGAVILK